MTPRIIRKLYSHFFWGDNNKCPDTIITYSYLLIGFMLNYSGVKKIECISLEGNFSVFLTDSFVRSIFKENTFEHLKIFDVRGRTPVPLTKNTAEKFMELPNIKELRMSSWNITDAEFKDLEDIVKSNGWDLHLTKRSFSTSNL